jgi:hypothetical protein
MNLKPLGSNKTQLTIEKDGHKTEILFSYQTPVAARVIDECGASWYRTDCRWSRTTERHINSWVPKNFAEYKPQSFFDELAGGVK